MKPLVNAGWRCRCKRRGQRCNFRAMGQGASNVVLDHIKSVHRGEYMSGDWRMDAIKHNVATGVQGGFDVV